MDSELIHNMQVEAFGELLEKYQDVETNPGAESIEDVERRVGRPNAVFHLITHDNRPIGAVCVVERESTIFRISPLFILPDFQGRGYAKVVIKLLENMNPQGISWELATIKEEDKLKTL